MVFHRFGQGSFSRILDEPIQVTKVEVGRVEQGKGVDVEATTISRPAAVVGGELAALFPEPLPMPEMDAGGGWPGAEAAVTPAMPEPPEMPVIDWAEVAPPMPEVPSLEEARSSGDE